MQKNMQILMENVIIIKTINNTTHLNLSPILGFFTENSLYYVNPRDSDHLLKKDEISGEGIFYLFSEYLIPLQNKSDQLPFQINLTNEDFYSFENKSLERRARLRIFDQAIQDRNLDNCTDFYKHEVFNYVNISYKLELKKFTISRLDLMHPPKVKAYLEKLFQHNSNAINDYYFDYFRKCHYNDLVLKIKTSNLPKKDRKKLKKALTVDSALFITNTLKKHLPPLDPNIDTSNKFNRNGHNFISFLHEYLKDPNLNVFTDILNTNDYFEQTGMFLNLNKQIEGYIKKITSYFYIMDFYLRLEPSLEPQIREIFNNRGLYEIYYANSEHIEIRLTELPYIYIYTNIDPEEPIVRRVNRFIAFLVQMEEVYFLKIQYISLLVYEKRNTKLNHDT